MLAKKNVDDLSQPSRDFYERSKLKMSASLFFISLAIFLLGLCSEAGGKSLYNDFLRGTGGDDEVNGDLSAGFGFACFLYILGFFLALAASVYVSPLAGSKMEAKILSTPQELDPTADIVDSTMNPAFAHAEPVFSGHPDSANKN